MTWAPGPVVTRRRLGGELKRLRLGAGLLLEDVAKKLECSPSKISRLENGKGIPRWRDVRDMLDVYAVPEGEFRERLLDWSRTGQQKMWWKEFADVLPGDTLTYVELEWDAARVRAYESYLVHGLLQTRDYARAVLHTVYGDSLPPRQIERLVEVRMRRQEVLGPDHGLAFCAVVDESTLYREVGSAEVLAAQLRHLVGAAGSPRLELRVLPFSAGLVPASRGAFAKLDFSDGLEHGLVHLERPGGVSEFLAEPGEVGPYEARLEALLEAALPERDSVPLIERALGRLTSV